MKTVELIARLNITASRYYQYRMQGIIPPPSEGFGLRKMYSDAQVKQILQIFEQPKTTK